MRALSTSLSIRGKLIAAGAVFVVFGLASAFVTWMSLASVSRSIERQDRIAAYQANALKSLNALNKYSDILSKLGQSDLSSEDASALKTIVAKRGEAFRDSLAALETDAQAAGLPNFEPPGNALETLNDVETKLLDAIRSGESGVAQFLLSNVPSASNTLRTALEKQASKAESKLMTVRDAAQTTRDNARLGTLLATGLQVVLGLAAVLAIALFGISRPINRLAAVMRRLASGESALAVPETDRRDEIGHMAQAVTVFRDQARENERLSREHEAERQRRAEERRETREAIASELETTVGEATAALNDASQQLNSDARSLSRNADTARRTADEVAEEARQASVNVQTVSGATEELSTSISEIRDQVSEASRIAQEARTEASSTNERVATLEKAASEIGDIVQLINDIADKTNLLALNATIEAARAGEAGKGFAVVANEVKNLAAQTTKATENISDKIKQIQTETNHAVTAIGSISETVTKINNYAADIASRVEQQRAATKDIASNVEQASTSTSQAADGIRRVAEATQDADKTAGSVTNAADQLQTQADNLRARLNGVVADIRAA